MPNFEFEFNQQDRQLVVEQQATEFNGNDYIRLTIYPTEAIDNIVTLPNTNEQAIFYSSLNPTAFNINISPFGVGLDELRLKTIGGVGPENDFKIYKKSTDDFGLGEDALYIKPNEIFNQFELPQGDYRIQVDFLNQVAPPFVEPDEDDEIIENDNHYQFIIRQVSTSRKEVRLKLLDRNIISDSDVIENLTNAFNNFEPELLDDDSKNPNYKYQFKHILNIGTGDHNPIMNYAFDAVTDGQDNQSIILKLYEALPIGVGNLSMVTLEREILTTQLQDIFYFSDVPDVFFGDGLIPQPQEDYINPDESNLAFESFNDLTGSIDNNTINGLVSKSLYDYPNLNTDFSKLENHTFFGSAKKKLENFKTKVETIQGYYTDISSSLSISESVNATKVPIGSSDYTVQLRKNLFKKVNDEIKTFTPYERFLYYDGQLETTSSAPGLGKNYASTIPVTQQIGEGEAATLNGFDGFNVVYQHSNKRLDDIAGGIPSPTVDLFTGKYQVHEKPFFNYSGSIYLSFLIKANTSASIQGPLNNENSRRIKLGGGETIPLPFDAFHTKNILKPETTASEYRRFIYEVSSSYWVPTNVNNDDDVPINFDIKNITDFDGTSTHYEVLSGSMNIKTGSSKIKDSTGKYPTTVITASGVSFSGSCMPAGELFRINYASGSGGNTQAFTQSFTTNVNVTLNNPTNVLPFDNVVKTTSTEWTDWYNGAIDSASAFDTDNIHSFENNLPLYIQESSDYNDMKGFLNLQGEQYDLIKNHIDSLGTLHKRGYKKTNSPPDNTLPMLLSNMGWQAINPFTGSLTDTLGNYLTSVTSIDDIKTNTWRKTLNNLIYIYKSKGTRIFINNPPTGSGVDLDLNSSTGSFSFTSNKKKLYNYNIGATDKRILNLDWWMDSANLNTIEFVYKHSTTTNTQELLKSSGSGAQNLWDLRLKPDTAGVSSSFEFRLNNSRTGSLAIASNAVSMSTSFSTMTDGQLWNVMLQRVSASITSSGTQEYRLYAGLQKGKTIDTLGYISMSISGGLTEDNNNLANQNFQSSGSRHPLSSSNLVVGRTITGSVAQIKGWNTSLSASKFRQHVLNKFSTVGNSITAHKDELIYHFKLNENYSSASVSSSTQTLNIVDSAPTTTYSDYSFTKPGTTFNTSSVYGIDLIEVVKLTLQDNTSKANDNNILINPRRNVVSDLSPIQSAVKPLESANSKPLFNTSAKLELYRSPQTFVDNFILDTLSGYNFETLYGNPQNYYSQSYDEFDTFREENMFNHSISEGLKSIVPARSTFSDKNSNFGVEIKPTILEKQKYENMSGSVEVNPNNVTGSINPVVSSPTTTYEQEKTGSISVISSETIMTGSKIETAKTGSISATPSLTDSGIETAKTGSIDYASIANKSFENIHDSWGAGHSSGSDTHFINYYGGTGSYDNYNTYHIDTRVVFHTIGDQEYYSASYDNASSFEDHTRFYNRLYITDDFNSSANYDGKSFGTGSGIITGRMMGKTRYFTTGSNDNIVLPSNHVNKFSNPFTEQMLNGAQNTSPGILNVQYEDVSTSSFYRQKVTGGDREIIVRDGKSPTLGSDGIVKY